MQHMKLHVDEEVDGGAHIEDIPDKQKVKQGDKGQEKKEHQQQGQQGDRVVNAPQGFRPTRKVREGE